MAAEGPFLAAIIARLPDATYNLAAYGVAFALAIVIEGPVMMLMSAATSLVKDRISYTKLRNFSRVLAVGTTLFLLLFLYPPFYRLLVDGALGLPREVADLTYGALWFFIPWPAAIAYRRFIQGVLIRSGKTRLVAYGTAIRFIGMMMAAFTGYFFLNIPGAFVGSLALSTGVVVEAVAARFMADSTIRAMLGGDLDEGPSVEISYREISAFYFPLALTSLIGLSIQPLLTFFMGRSVAPIESLAVFPVIVGLSFFFRSLGLAFQDAAIALMGERFKHLPELGRFAASLALVTTGCLALITLTPLAQVYFLTLSGLSEELTRFAVIPARIIVPLPALTVLLTFQRAILVEGRRTHQITVASTIEISMVAAMFVILGWGLDLVGVTAAFSAFLIARIVSNSYLMIVCRGIVKEVGETP